MNAKLSDQLIFRIEKLYGKPISRGIDKVLNEILDNYEEKRKK